MTTTGHAGHVLPLVPLAHALLRAGHEVRIAGPADRAAVVERTGVRFPPLAAAPEAESWPVYESTLGMSHEDANARVIGEIFGRIYAQAALPGVLDAVATWCPHLIVRESYEFASVVAAERHGIPHARVGTGLAAMEESTLRLAAAVNDELDAGAIRSSPYLTQTPLALEDPAGPAQPDTHRFRAGSGGPRIARGDDRAPLVYVSFGSVAGALPFFPGLYRAAIDALAGLEARVLVTVGNDRDPAELGSLPANVRVERWVPHDVAMAQAAVAVGHGGYGSTVGALAAGVPLVLVPLFADQPYNAARVAELGAGIALLPFPTMGAAISDGPASLGALRGAVERALGDPRYRCVAERVAAETRALPSPGPKVTVLEAVACHHPGWCSVEDQSSSRASSASASEWMSAGSSSSS